MSSTANIPDFSVTMDGKDLTSTMRPLLIDLSLTEKRGGEADQLDITLTDHDGRLAIPKPGVRLNLKLGWKSGSDVVVGLIDKGDFVVDAVEHSGPPDVITLRARAADLTGGLRTRRERSWKNTTLGAIIKDVAGKNGLTPRVSPDLASIALPSVVQSRESDIALLKRLGKEHDAVATIKGGALIFARIGSGLTPTGKAIPPITVRRRDGDGHRYSIEKQDESSGVEASYHDVKSGKKKKVVAGANGGGTGKTRKLSRTYATEAAAKAAAKAEHSRAARLPVKLSFNLALGRSDLYPERRLTASGFKAEIDATKWLIAEVSHRLGNGGFTTSLQMEAV